jgi:hypothetical protein
LLTATRYKPDEKNRRFVSWRSLGKVPQKRHNQSPKSFGNGERIDSLLAR